MKNQSEIKEKLTERISELKKLQQKNAEYAINLLEDKQ